MEINIEDQVLHLDALLAYVLSGSPRIMRFVNKIYDENPSRYSEFAQSNPQSKSRIATGNRYPDKIAIFKTIGIITVAEHDAEIKTALHEQIVRVYKAEARYFEMFKSLDSLYISDFAVKILARKDASKRFNLSDRFTYGLVSLFCYFMIHYEKQIKIRDSMERRMFMEIIGQETSALKPPAFLHNNYLKQLNPNPKQKGIIKFFDDEFFQSESIIECFRCIHEKNMDIISVFRSLWDISQIDNVPISIVENEKYSKPELAEMKNVILYHFLTQECPLHFAKPVFLFAMIMRGYAKVYLEACQRTENQLDQTETQKTNQSALEDMKRLQSLISEKEYVLVSRQKLINDQQLEIDRLNKLLSKKNETIDSLRLENTNLKHAIDTDKFFCQHMKQEQSSRSDNDERFKSLNVILFGGPPSWQAQVRDRLSNIIFIDANDVTFHLKIVDKADAVAFRSDYMSHKQYQRVMNRARLFKIPMVYVGNNIDMLQQKILSAVDNRMQSAC